MSHENASLVDSVPGRSITRCVLTEAEQRLRLLERKVSHLLAQVQDGEFHFAGYCEVSGLLEVILLPESDFALARRHLQNSSDYCQVGEYGASAFELRIVRGILQRL